MTSRSKYGFAVALAVGGVACGGVVGSTPPDGSVSVQGEEGGTTQETTGDSAGTVTAHEQGSATSDVGADGPGGAYTDGTIATDGTNVYWIQEPLAADDAGADGPFEIVYCPTAGCPSSGPTTFWSGVNSGALMIAGGRIYFQGLPSAASNQDGWGCEWANGVCDGPLLDCALSGCGSEPTVFTTIVNSGSAPPSLASDGANIYWEDGRTGNEWTVYSCALGATCTSPKALTSVANPGTGSGDSVPPWSFTVDSGNLYWLNFTEYAYPDSSDPMPAAIALESMPVGGGAVSNVCTVPIHDICGGTVAVLQGDAYMSLCGAQGIQRCSLAGGAPTEYMTAHEGASVTTDGTHLFWLTNYGFAYSTETHVNMLTPGASSATPLMTLDPNQGCGYTVYGSTVYAISGTLHSAAM
jgi:hypothetical protein